MHKLSCGGSAAETETPSTYPIILQTTESRACQKLSGCRLTDRQRCFPIVWIHAWINGVAWLRIRRDEIENAPIYSGGSASTGIVEGHTRSWRQRHIDRREIARSRECIRSRSSPKDISASTS